MRTVRVWRRGNFAPLGCPRMSWFKMSKQSHQPTQQLVPFGVPTHTAGPLGLDADVEMDTGPEGLFRLAMSVTNGTNLTTAAGVNNGGGPRNKLRDWNGEGTLAPTLEDEDSVRRECAPPSSWWDYRRP